VSVVNHSPTFLLLARQNVRRLIVCVILATQLSMSAFAQSSAGPRSGTTIDGVVVDTMSQPLSGARVTLVEKSNSSRLEEKTKPDGTFVFSAVTAGTYVVTAEKPGFHSSSEDSLAVVNGEQRHLRLLLKNANSAAASSSHTSAPETMNLDDKPNFIVAGVSDWTAAGGHGSDSNLRASEKLTRETLALKKDADAAEPNGKANTATHPELIAAREEVRRQLAKENTAELHNRLGELNEQLGDPLQAVREYEQATQLDPSERNYFDWGTELLLHRAVKPAVEVLSKGAAKYPNSERMLAGLGAALYASGSYNEAAKRVCEASDIKPADPAPYLFLGQMEKAAPEPLECVESKLARFTGNEPKNAFANYYYALSLWKRQQRGTDPRVLQRAQELLQNAVTLDPKLGEAYLQLGILYSAQTNHERATAEYKKAIEAQPQLGEAHYRLAQAYKRTGEKEKAQQEFGAYQQIEKQEAAEVDRQRREVRQFLIVLKDQPSASSPQ
jgi:tetratricopeptide (TPR) repeat protein